MNPPVPPSSQPPPRDDRSLARSVGEFFGHIWRGIRQDPRTSPQATREVGRSTEVEHRDTPRGPVVLRRTIIEEIELPRPPRPQPPGPPQP
ncbi:MAG: hypothetical protein IBJ11_07310 [Phycisphaerales bacterium]|nr:hypothetical protein [Phycisphaerales bacterium]